MARNIHHALPTKESNIIRTLRDRKGLTLRETAKLTGRSVTLLTHLENGWNPIRDHHLAWLLPLYGVTKRQFELMVSGEVYLPEHLRELTRRQIDLVADDKLDLVHGLLAALTAQGSFKGDSK